MTLFGVGYYTLRRDYHRYTYCAYLGPNHESIFKWPIDKHHETHVRGIFALENNFSNHRLRENFTFFRTGQCWFPATSARTAESSNHSRSVHRSIHFFVVVSRRTRRFYKTHSPSTISLFELRRRVVFERSNWWIKCPRSRWFPRRPRVLIGTARYAYGPWWCPFWTLWVRPSSGDVLVGIERRDVI